MTKFFAFMFLIFSLSTIGIASAQDDKLQVVATTTLIADVARNVGGDLIVVTALIPAEADAHAFEPSPNDVVKVAQADIVLVNGAGLEAFLGSLLENAGAEAFVVSNGIEMLAFGNHDEEEHADEADHEREAAEIVGILGEEGVCEDHHDEHDEEVTEEAEHEHEHGACDPHVWTDPLNVMIWADNIAKAFTLIDPDNAVQYRANADAYMEQLSLLHLEIEGILSAIPEENRVLVTNHEFLGYFARRYDFEIVGTVISGGGTLSEPDPQSLAELVDIIREHGVTAIFAETSANSQLAETIAQETGINVVTTLYSDSLSAADEPASTYLDYLRYNATTIADALSE